MQPGAVVTPEAVPLDFEVAGIGSRFLALALDWLVQGAALFGVLLAGGVATAAVGGGGSGVTAALALLAVFLTVFGYPVAFETLWRGRTIGKAALGLRVVTREGAPVGVRHAAIRAALGIVDFGLVGIPAVVCALLTRPTRRLGDVVAGTLVLRERTGMRAPAPVVFTVPPGLEAFAATLDTAALTPDDYAAVRALLVRAPTLRPDVRARVAAELAAPVAARLRTTVPGGVHPETFLACVAAVHQRRARAAAGPPPPPPPPPAARPPATPPPPGPFAPPG